MLISENTPFTAVIDGELIFPAWYRDKDLFTNIHPDDLHYGREFILPTSDSFQEEIQVRKIIKEFMTMDDFLRTLSPMARKAIIPTARLLLNHDLGILRLFPNQKLIHSYSIGVGKAERKTFSIELGKKDPISLGSNEFDLYIDEETIFISLTSNSRQILLKGKAELKEILTGFIMNAKNADDFIHCCQKVGLLRSYHRLNVSDIREKIKRTFQREASLDFISTVLDYFEYTELDLFPDSDIAATSVAMFGEKRVGKGVKHLREVVDLYRDLDNWRKGAEA